MKYKYSNFITSIVKQISGHKTIAGKYHLSQTSWQNIDIHSKKLTKLVFHNGNTKSFSVSCLLKLTVDCF